LQSSGLSSSVQRDPEILFAPPSIDVEQRTDGTVILRSPQPLLPFARCVGEWLQHWAERAGERVFLSERDEQGEWQGIAYAAALDSVRRIAAWLLRSEQVRGRPIAILSDNSIEHGLLALGAMHAGIPVVPISSAYSLVSQDFAKLRAIIASVDPGLLYVSNGLQFNAALAAIRDLHSGLVVVGSGQAARDGWTSFDQLLSFTDDSLVDAAFARVGPDTIAKLLFTSGSTGKPKGVINTHKMLCANQQQAAQVWPFIADSHPVIVDWLPWNHTFGGNHDFNLVLRNGGTLYIDDGRPVAGRFTRTITNLCSVPSTIHFNVPRGYDMLVAALRSDSTLRRTFFSQLQVMFYAAAALPQHLWEALEALALESTGEYIPLVSAWGSTETAPLATSCHFRADRSGVIGIPVPGCELKLVKSGAKQEVRVRGPLVTPGYWKDPELSARSFDHEGFYRIGDALRMVDPDKPESGRPNPDFTSTGGCRRTSSC
jgi:feruloyl-CoA synthase